MLLTTILVTSGRFNLFRFRSTLTAKNTVISPNFLVWEFCGKAQFPHITRIYTETVPYHKISTPGNSVKLGYFFTVTANWDQKMEYWAWNWNINILQDMKQDLKFDLFCIQLIKPHDIETELCYWHWCVSINKHHKLKSYLHRPAGFMIQVEDGFLRNSSTNKL